MKKSYLLLICVFFCEVSCNHVSYDSDGYARVEKNGKIGLIDSQKRQILPFEYDHISLFNDGVATVKKNGKMGAVDTVGKTVLLCTYEDLYYDGGVFVGEKTPNKWVIVSKSRGYYAESKTELKSIARFGDDSLASAQDDSGRFGIINKAGGIVVPFLSESPFRFDSDGFACVKQKGKYGVINTDLKIVVPIEYDNNDIHFTDNIALVERNGQFGAVEIQGLYLANIVPCVYANRNDVKHVLGNRWLLGTWVLRENYVTAYYTFHGDGHCVCRMEWIYDIPTSYAHYEFKINGNVISIITDDDVIKFHQLSKVEMYVDSFDNGIPVKLKIQKL